ncbi:MAG TPA: hypothetical protein EYG38_08810 [Verrucomicrobia bacterium]|nr:hypothetical protein [Verrucomicrobiota bacterium]
MNKTLPHLFSTFISLVTLTVNAQSQVLIPSNAQWQYHKGRVEPSRPINAWRFRGFDAGDWVVGVAPFRYGDGKGGTVLNDMQNNYSTVYIRKEFTVTNVEDIGDPDLFVDYDDGFIMWINGVEVAQTNETSEPRFNSFSSDNHESGDIEIFELPDPRSYLVSGVNIVAVQIFNISLESSDFMMNPTIRYSTPDHIPPTIVEVRPSEGVLKELSEITVVFSEAVSGLQAEDLMLNGVSAISVTGKETQFTFQVKPPEPGEIVVRIASDASWADTSRPANMLDRTGLGSSWRYNIVDEFSPRPILILPQPQAKVRSTSVIEVSFNELVSGVDASDLMLNGTPAKSLIKSESGAYKFFVGNLSKGQYVASWIPDPGIQDLAETPNMFHGGEWSFEVDPDFSYGGIQITELNAANRDGLRTLEQTTEDWVELRNSGNDAIDLSGWSLSDDPERPGKWVFSETRIEAGKHLLVFCSGLDLRSGPELHTNFKLSASGEFLGLYSPVSPREVVSEVMGGFPEQRNDHSYGLGVYGKWHFHSKPTPRGANDSPGMHGLLAPPSFSEGRGIKNNQITIRLASPDSEAEIRYTLDGATPDAFSSTLYTKPIHLNRTTIVRAATFRTGYVSSPVATHSYFYQLDDALRSLPIISLSTDPSNLLGPKGIMETNPRNTIHHGIAWERPVSAEIINPETGEDIQLDCGLRIRGGDYIRSAYNPYGSPPSSKYSFRLYFRGKYGQSRLDYPLIPGSKIQSFKQIVLRAGMNDSHNPFVVDEIVRRLSKNMGHVSSRGGYANLFINGLYQGYYNPTERIGENFLADWHGAGMDWDIIAQGSEVRAGDRDKWNQMLGAIHNRNMADFAAYRLAEDHLDMINFVDYILLNEFVGMNDWPDNNWRAARERIPGAKFRFYVWDGERAFGHDDRSATVNVFRRGLKRRCEISNLFNSLSRNPEFRLLFQDRVQKHMFNGGALTTSRVIKEYQWQRETLSMVISRMEALDQRFIIPRRDIVITHLKTQGFWGSTTAPEFSQFGGRVSTGYKLKLTAMSGHVYFTTDGSDPRIVGSAQIAPAARPASADGLTIGKTQVVKARTLTGNTWSALTEARFTVKSIQRQK